MAVLALFQDLIAQTLQIPFLLPPPLVVLAQGGDALLLLAGIAGVSSLYPVARAMRAEPYETIRRGAS
jgi:ABC-type lipoprotein release transport system permease subunit